MARLYRKGRHPLPLGSCRRGPLPTHHSAVQGKIAFGAFGDEGKVCPEKSPRKHGKAGMGVEDPHPPTKEGGGVDPHPPPTWGFGDSRTALPMPDHQSVAMID